jgi:hypothetical protein
MDNLILMKESDLRRILREELSGINTPEPAEKENFSIDEAVEYLESKGYKISKATLYGHTSKGTIDYFRFGKRKLSFSKNHLDTFLNRMKNA